MGRRRRRAAIASSVRVAAFSAVTVRSVPAATPRPRRLLALLPCALLLPSRSWLISPTPPQSSVAGPGTRKGSSLDTFHSTFCYVHPMSQPTLAALVVRRCRLRRNLSQAALARSRARRSQPSHASRTARPHRLRSSRRVGRTDGPFARHRPRRARLGRLGNRSEPPPLPAGPLGPCSPGRSIHRARATGSGRRTCSIPLRSCGCSTGRASSTCSSADGRDAPWIRCRDLRPRRHSSSQPEEPRAPLGGASASFMPPFASKVSPTGSPSTLIHHCSRRRVSSTW